MNPSWHAAGNVGIACFSFFIYLASNWAFHRLALFEKLDEVTVCVVGMGRVSLGISILSVMLLFL
jgi:hypothetical protein